MTWIVIGSVCLIALSVVLAFIAEWLRVYDETERQKQADREEWDYENWEVGE